MGDPWLLLPEAEPVGAGEGVGAAGDSLDGVVDADVADGDEHGGPGEGQELFEALDHGAVLDVFAARAGLGVEFRVDVVGGGVRRGLADRVLLELLVVDGDGLGLLFQVIGVDFVRCGVARGLTYGVASSSSSLTSSSCSPGVIAACAATLRW